MLENEILKFFAEPIFKYKFDKAEIFNKELTEYIYNLQKEDKNGISRSNRGGWHSKNFELKDQNSIQFKFALELQKYILDAFQKFGWDTKKNIRIKEMWSIINQKNNFNVLHTHPNCYLSAAYYVKAPEKCGKFVIETPNIAKKHFFPPIAQTNELNTSLNGLEINEGDLLLFPGYLPHKVAKNESEEDRIVISFNVDIKN